MGERRRLQALALLAIAAFVSGCTSGAAGRARPSAGRTTHRAGSPSPRAGGTISSAGGTTASGSARPASPSVAGRLLTRTIPGSSSGFTGRLAYIWVPPALVQHPQLRLPVLELLHGTPGGPDSWVSLGQARATLDAFAARHGGRGPIVVMPDINGSHRADSECITTPGGADVERYLTVDVPNWVSAQYPGTAGRRWGVAGLSEGGMCAVMLALRHPGRYAVFGDFSGLGRPTTGSRDDPATTLRVLFHGSRTAYDQHDPGWLLQHNRYPTLSGWFEYGLSDVEARDATRRLAAQAQAAGVTVRELAASGRHSWTIWTSALQTLLPWMWEKL